MKTKIIILIIISFSLFFLTPHITRAAVIINEIAWMGTENSASDEWMELYSSQQTDLSGWLLEAIDGTPIINLEGSISANGYFLLERTDDNPIPHITADQIYTGALSNTGENLKLKDSDGNIIDEIDCSDGWLAGDNSTKQTMEKISNGWQTSLNSGGTPKSQNSSGKLPSVDPPADESETMENNGTSASNESTTDKSGDSTGNNPPIADAGNDIAAFTDEEITFDGSKSYDSDNDELIYIWNLGGGILKEDTIVVHKYSYPGTYLVTLTVRDGKYSKESTITVKIYPKKIFINEFLPNPIGKDAGDEENPGEWIELYNNSDQIIDIGGWQVDDEEGGSKPFIFPENTLIAPESFLVFSRQVTGLALNNDGDEVRFLLPTGVVFQKITYEKAPEGQSSARTAEGFIWDVPTPGISNNKPLQSEIISPSKDEQTYIAQPKNLAQKDSAQDKNQNYYNLANLEKSPENNNKLILIVITIAIVVSAVGIGILKLKKKS